ncbi:MAG: PASTA domain-containing protein [Bacteroidetes bacterium]|nr:PASTA domain-containing protein [Bacteroidota bacterium]MBS1756550.1 PASTA domain-containing protein [Bacteroidota bacterium]
MFNYITNKPFWVNLLVAIGLAFLIVFGFLQLLGKITRHGQYLTVPSVTGRNTEDAIKFLESKGFEVTIQDSVYTDTAKMGIVLKQLPEPNSTVKVNRTVLLTVNRVTLPLVEVPALQGKTLNFAIELLQRNHLQLGDTTYKPDFMMGSVLEQKYKGAIINAGAKLTWGSKVDLVIAGGLAQEHIMVPSLIGMTYGEAKTLLQGQGISIGALIPDPGITDTAAAFIYKQNPPRFTEDKQPVYIQSGQLMDLWISPVMKTPVDSSNINQQ